MIDRRDFTKVLLLGAGAGLLGFPEEGWSSGEPERVGGTVVADARTGRIVHRSGVAARRFAPCSTFKIPIALMGYDANILTGLHTPAWDYRPGVHEAYRAEEKRRIDPTSWLANSVLWYSREITRRLGERRFGAYVDRFGYGNRDVSGNPGRHDGLTHSWLGSSLAISPDEQVAFLRRLLARDLGIAPRASAQVEAIMPRFAGTGGWAVRGKTGSSARDADDRAIGWFVGWADRGEGARHRRLVFARVEYGVMPVAGGPFVREGLLKDIGRLAG